MRPKEAEILGKYLPSGSIDYCFSLWQEHRIQLTISRPRKSIYGNYQFRNGGHHITVNGNLSKEAFLVTYLHEVAHLISRKKYRNRIKPHGPEWQGAFAAVMKPVLHDAVFSENLLEALKKHLKKPAATSCADPELHRLLNNEVPGENQKRAIELQQGDFFVFQNKGFEWRRKLRNYCEIRNIENGRLYRISGSALVEISHEDVQNRMLSRNNTTLRFLAEGAEFMLDNKHFRKLELKRSRVLCEEVGTAIRYLIGAEREIAGGQLIKVPSAEEVVR